VTNTSSCFEGANEKKYLPGQTFRNVRVIPEPIVADSITFEPGLLPCRNSTSNSPEYPIELIVIVADEGQLVFCASDIDPETIKVKTLNRYFTPQTLTSIAFNLEDICSKIDALE
jgi:hypothetical protein